MNRIRKNPAKAFIPSSSIAFNCIRHYYQKSSDIHTTLAGNGYAKLTSAVDKNKYIVEVEIEQVQHAFTRLSYSLVKHTIGEETLNVKKINFDVINTHPDINEAVPQSSLKYITRTISNATGIQLRSIANNSETKYNTLYVKAFKSLKVIEIKYRCKVKTLDNKTYHEDDTKVAKLSQVATMYVYNKAIGKKKVVVVKHLVKTIHLLACNN